MTLNLFLRYRYETADDGPPGIDDGLASTLRIAPGYRTGDYHDASLYVQLEDVLQVGTDSFDDGIGPPSGWALVPDPEGFELKQAYLHYAGLPRTVFTAGRQLINHRAAPFNRFIGDQGWRQHFQAFDAFRAVTLAIPDVVGEYAYVWNVNRANGERNRLPDGSDYTMNTHWLNWQYSGLSFAKVEQYLYLLDFTTRPSAGFSTVTAGLRGSGDRIVYPATRLTYAGEYAYQADYADNPHDIGAHYALAQLGLTHVIDSPLEAVGLTFAYELLGGQGGLIARGGGDGDVDAPQGAGRLDFKLHALVRQFLPARRAASPAGKQAIGRLDLGRLIAVVVGADGRHGLIFRRLGAVALGDVVKPHVEERVAALEVGAGNFSGLGENVGAGQGQQRQARYDGVRDSRVYPPQVEMEHPTVQ